MKNNLLPLGTRDEFGRRAEAKQHIIEVIQKHFTQRGFSKISTPLLEKQAVFEPYQLGNYQMYRLLDQEGDTIVLRPDMTLPIARFLSATSIPLPKKFCYVGDIFRISRRLSGSYNELTQAGIELVGYKSIKAELECLMLMNQLSNQLLSKPVEIELGYADFATAILRNLNIDETTQTQIATALYDKKIPVYEKLIEQFKDSKQYEFLLIWPRLFGDPDDIFSKLKEFELSNEIQFKVEKLKEIVDWIKETLPKQPISIDLSGRAPQKYYTGLTFRGFSKDGAGYLFSGGRYDRLLAGFQDQTEPAVGMGIDIDLLTDLYVKNYQNEEKTLIYCYPNQWQEAERVLKLTPNGILSLSDSRTEAIEEAKQINAKFMDLTGGVDLE